MFMSRYNIAMTHRVCLKLAGNINFPLTVTGNWDLYLTAGLC